MPRTRNVTRAQWDAANASNSTITGQHHGCESEKENEGRSVTRTTRSQTRNANRVLGATNAPTSKGPENTVPTNTSKVKGKGKAKTSLSKRKKIPLQDITSQFLPAPETANRGEENEHVISQQTDNRVNLVRSLPLTQILSGDVFGPTMSKSPVQEYLSSPLPPSSPPSAITSSPQYPKILPNPNTSWLALSSEHNLWTQFDDGRSASHGSPSVISSNSDPFGFVALERKLKVERSATAPALKRYHQQEESDEELGQVLVADTSSPRPVHRLKRPLYQGDSALLPAISDHPHYATPPTPHKDKKRQRLSHKEDGALSSFSSSIPSTPSPSKPPVQKHAKGAGEDTIKNNLKGNRAVGVLRRTRNRAGRGMNRGEPSARLSIAMTPLKMVASLDDDAEAERQQAGPKRVKAAKSKKITKGSRSTGTKKLKKEHPTENIEDNEDYGEVCSLFGQCHFIKLIRSQEWERERQERAAYFKRLEGYQVEKEDVYII